MNSTGYLRYFCMALVLLMALTSCARTRVQMTGDLWQQWRAMDALMQSDYPDAVPIVLVHGWNGSEFSWPEARVLAGLEQKLDRDIYYFSYRTGLITSRFPPIEILEEELERFLHNFRRVDIVAHSMGGLLIRQYLQHHPDHHIRRLVFLATPHFGTDAARTLANLTNVSPLGNLQAEEMQPGSGFLWQLNAAKGTELKGIEVLNVYVGRKDIVNSDFIVRPFSAYLPWGRNITYGVGHHSLARHFTESGLIMDFLASGALPGNAPPPEQRNIWLRVIDSDNRAYAGLSESSVKRLNAKGIPVHTGISVCCKLPTRISPGISRTVVLEDVQPDETIVIKPGKGLPTVMVHARNLLAARQPVVLKELKLPLAAR